METWVDIIGEPIAKKGNALVFGRGDNPINFVSARDVAALVELATTSESLCGAEGDIGGPENLTLDQFAQALMDVAGHPGSVRHVPRPMMRLAALLLQPLKPDVASLIRAGLVMDTTDMSLAGDARTRFPDIPTTSLTDVARHAYAARPSEP